MQSFAMLPLVVKVIALVLQTATSALTPVNDEATIIFAGDAMQHQAQLDAAKTRSGAYDYSECFAALSDEISGADYAVVNLETTLGGKGYTGYPCFTSPDSYAQALADAGFDMMLTANNHTLDRLDRGLERTIHVLDSMGVDHLGTYRNASERAERLPMIRDINGFKIGFLNYTYGTNGIKLKGNGIVDYIDREVIARDIQALRESGAELIAAAIHWGVEYEKLPHPTQKSLARYLADSGVEMIIGGHPHVIQPMELSEADSIGSRQLLVYSLGNFISNMRTTDARGGAILKVKLRRTADGHAIVGDAAYRLVFTVPPTDGHTNFRLMQVDSPSIPAQWKGRAAAFASSARKIFDRHNINVQEY